jgi:hypothetical protein
MDLESFGINVREQRDAGTCMLYGFGFSRGSERELLRCLIGAMKPGHELSVADPKDGDCSLGVRRLGSGFEIKRGCHGASGTWRPASLEDAYEWALPGVLWASKSLRPGYGASLAVYK